MERKVSDVLMLIYVIKLNQELIILVHYEFFAEHNTNNFPMQKWVNSIEIIVIHAIGKTLIDYLNSHSHTIDIFGTTEK